MSISRSDSAPTGFNNPVAKSTPSILGLDTKSFQSMQTMRNTFSFLTCFGSLFVAGLVSPVVTGQESAAPSFAAVADDLFADLFPELTQSKTDSTDAIAESSAKSATNESTEEPSTETTEKAEPATSNTPSTEKASSNTQESSETQTDPAESSATATQGPPSSASKGTGTATESTTKTEPEPALTPELIQLRERVRDCLGYYFNQQENVVDHSPWGVMHILIAYGVDTQVYASGRKTNAIGYLCFNGTCRGQQLFFVNRNKLETRIGPGVQGHDGQFLAMMAQSRVKIDYPMHVDGRNFTIRDLIEYEQQTCEAGTELTFKLIGLSHYLDTDTKWRNQAGEPWSIPRLIKEELAQPIIGAACGGTHRLMGFNYAVRKREKEGKSMDGQWLRARKFLDDYFEYTFYLQNQDHSFSTDFFRGRNSYGDVNQRIETTGHILEWFLASLSDKQLRDPRVIKGVDYLTKLMMQNRDHEWEIGPKGHALHALAIYSERVFGDKPGTRDPILARGRKLHISDQKQR
jgi:hypothetical protein